MDPLDLDLTSMRAALEKALADRPLTLPKFPTLELELEPMQTRAPMERIGSSWEDLRSHRPDPEAEAGYRLEARLSDRSLFSRPELAARIKEIHAAAVADGRVQADRGYGPGHEVVKILKGGELAYACSEIKRYGRELICCNDVVLKRAAAICTEHVRKGDIEFAAAVAESLGFSSEERAEIARLSLPECATHARYTSEKGAGRGFLECCEGLQIPHELRDKLARDVLLDSYRELAQKFVDATPLLEELHALVPRDEAVERQKTVLVEAFGFEDETMRWGGFGGPHYSPHCQARDWSALAQHAKIDASVLTDPAVVDAAKGAAKRYLAGVGSGISALNEAFACVPFGNDFWCSPEIKELGRSAYIRFVKGCQLTKALEVAVATGVESEFQKGEQAQAAVESALLNKARHGQTSDVKALLALPAADSSFLACDSYQEAALAGFETLCTPKRDYYVKIVATDIQKDLHLSQATLESEKGVETLGRVVDSLIKDNIVAAQTIIPLLPAEERKEAALRVIAGSFDAHVGMRVTNEFVARYSEPSDFSRILEQLPPLAKAFAVQFSIGSVEGLAAFYREQKTLVGWVAERGDTPRLTGDVWKKAQGLHISSVEAEILLRAEVPLTARAGKRDYAALVEDLIAHCPDWKDPVNIVRPLRKGIEVFGAEAMLRYTNTKASLHDSLHGFHAIVEMHRASGLSAADFDAKILRQVAKDGVQHTEGSAQNKLALIARNFTPSAAETMVAEARNYPQLKILNELAETLAAPGAVWASWRNLQRAYQLQQEFKKAEALKGIQKMRDTGKHALADYAEVLAFHPDSSVNMEAVFQFCFDPRAFLSRGDAHTNGTIHRALMPANFLNTPHLDLTAAELRDGLVEGQLDKAQALPPFSMRFLLPSDTERYPSARSALATALGSARRQIKGEARDSKLLFSRASAELRPAGVSVVAYLDGADVPAETEQALLRLAFDPAFGIAAPLQEFVLNVHPKSSPRAVLAGDDTASCMPLGSGKNNVYTFNLHNAIFTLEYTKQEGGVRTIAQSVLTVDRDIGIPFPTVHQAIARGLDALKEVLPPTVLNYGVDVLSADNVEVAPNYKTPEFKAKIKQLYSAFFGAYLRRYGEALGVDTTKMPVGEGYSFGLDGLERVPNTFLPLTAVGYSDKNHAEARLLPCDPSPPFPGCVLTAGEVPAIARRKVSGTIDLTYRDVLPTAYLEGKAYDNDSLVVSLGGIQSWLLAKDINNQLKGRQNLSVKHLDENGRMTGYLIAYEGRMAVPSASSPEQSPFRDAIYIADLAGDPASRNAAPRLIGEFGDRYARTYLDCDNPLPIVADMRETTTFSFVTRRLARLANHPKYTFEIEDLGTKQQGTDTMHRVVIRPVRREKHAGAAETGPNARQ